MQNPGIANRPPTRENRGVEPARVLLVDGYNILHAWGWLSTRDATAAALEVARSRLIETVRTMHDVDGYDVTVVFDGRGPSPSVDPASQEPGFRVIFAPVDRTADTVIEALAAAAPDPRSCTVATADALERETISAAGASCLSPEDLRAWCERSRDRATRAAARSGDRSRAGWGNKLPL